MPYSGQEGDTARDQQRRERLEEAIREAGLDALVASLPENVLLLTGYFPVVGTSVALATRDGAVFCIAPRDERELAERGGADEVILFEPASLDRIETAAEAIREPLRKLLHQRHLEHAAIGSEEGETYEAASYASMHLYGGSIPELLDPAVARPASTLFARLKATLTPTEIERLRRSCRIAGTAFEQGREHLAPGVTETRAAAAFRAPLSTFGTGFENAVSRADGYVSCMAGEHSAHASGAYARSRSTAIGSGDFVLTHCNSYADGYWTDITRTYCMGPPDERRRRMYEAVFEARRAALNAIRPGVRAREVDRAAREVMRAYGFAEQFRHGTGHGVGFSAINHNALPRIHPQSEDRLETGMVFNVEPAVYLEGVGGLRHCDMTLVTSSGAAVLTPWDGTIQDLLQ